MQKPGIDDLLKADLSFIYIASRLLEFLQPDFERTSISAIASDIRSSMLEELDFEKEARNIEEFRYFLSDNDLQKVATAPKVYSKSEVLNRHNHVLKEINLQRDIISSSYYRRIYYKKNSYNGTSAWSLYAR